MAASIDTSHFRQGSGRLCLDFIRTLRHRGTAEVSEELVDSLALAAWVRQFGPCETGPAAPPPDPSQIKAARALREAVHQLIQAARGEGGAGSCDRASVELVNRAATHPVPAPGLDPSGRLHWYADEPVMATLALVARDALDLATTPAATRIRECAGPRCGALFLDNSRPGTRRWCSMDTCGNRAKKTALRDRAATSTA